MTTALLTDRYELTMLDAAILDGTATNKAVFEVFGRDLPADRTYGVVAGTARLIEAIMDFRFDAADLAEVEQFVSPETGDFLAVYRFTGTIWAYPEGEVYFPGSPIVRIEGRFCDTLLETLVLSILNHDCAVASAASRMVQAANGKPLIEMGGRRTDAESAVHAARAAYIAGFSATSNLRAGQQYGIPTAGTAAHAFILSHRTEREAFDSQIAALGVNTTLLVDTYDTEEGVRTAVKAAQAVGATGPGSVRIDSNLGPDSCRARYILDKYGATDTKIVASGDLDEYTIAALEAAHAPIDSYGVGTSVVTGSGHPAAGLVYKLVAVAYGPDEALVPVAKKQTGKATVGGVKTVWRTLDQDGKLVKENVEVITTEWGQAAIAMGGHGPMVQEVVLRDGRDSSDDVTVARARHAQVVKTLLSGGVTHV